MSLDFSVGDPVGEEAKFVIIKKLGQGAFGSVYEAKDRESGDVKALKFFGKVEELYAERAVYMQLGNCSGAPFADGWSPVNKPFYLSLSVEGESFEKIRVKSKHGMITSRRLLSLAWHSIEAVKSVHQMGVLHRDLHSGNLCRSLSPNKSKVILIDFGMAFIVKRENGHRIYDNKVLRRTGHCSLRVARGVPNQEPDDLHSLALIFVKARKAWGFKKADLATQIVQKEKLFDDPANFLGPDEQFLAPILQEIYQQPYDSNTLPDYSQIQKTIEHTKHFHKYYAFDDNA